MPEQAAFPKPETHYRNPLSGLIIPQHEIKEAQKAGLIDINQRCLSVQGREGKTNYVFEGETPTKFDLVWTTIGRGLVTSRCARNGEDGQYPHQLQKISFIFDADHKKLQAVEFWHVRVFCNQTTDQVQGPVGIAQITTYDQLRELTKSQLKVFPSQADIERKKQDYKQKIRNLPTADISLEVLKQINCRRSTLDIGRIASDEQEEALVLERKTTELKTQVSEGEIKLEEVPRQIDLKVLFRRVTAFEAPAFVDIASLEKTN